MTAPVYYADADLKSRVTRYLNHRAARTIDGLSIEARGGTIVLQGSVSSLYEQELCRHVCTRVAGVLRVIDQTVVCETVAAPESPELAVSRMPR